MNSLALRRTVARVKSVREARARRELRDRESAQAEAARQAAAAAAAEQVTDERRACAEQVLRQAWLQGGAAAELRALRSSLQRRELELGEARSATAAAEQVRDDARDEVTAAQGAVLAAGKAHERAREAVREARAEWRAGILKRQDLELDDRPARRCAAAAFTSCAQVEGKT
jgi:hypothetical protein